MPRRSNSSESSGNRRGSSRSSKPSSRGKSDDKPYSSRSGSSKKPFKKSDSEGGKSFRGKSESKFSDDTRGTNRSEGKRPFKKSDSDRPFRKKPDTGFGETRSSRSDAGKRPFKKFDSEGGKSFRQRDERSNERRGADRTEGKRPFKKFDSERPFPKKPGEGFDENRSSGKRPFRKSDSDEGKSFRKRDEGYTERRGTDRTEGKRPFKKFDSERPFRKKTDEGSDDTRSGNSRGFKKFDSRDADKPFRGKRAESSSESKPRKFSSEKSFDKSKSYRGDRSSDKPSFKSSRPVPLDAPVQTEKIRLNKYISNSGVCSRREADELITMGLISVNGKVITELGYKVNPGDEVRHESKVLRAERPVYVLMNKPKGFLTTTSDPQERNTVMHIVGDAVKERIYPVGRLDRNTTGLLLLTNDGDLADKLMHPSYNAKKIYKAELDKPLTKADFQKILEGVHLEEGRAMVDDLAIISDDGKTVGLEIHIGWNRVVRRIFESLGYNVVKLDRSVYAGLDKKDLPRGHWRFLTREEIVMLKHYK